MAPPNPVAFTMNRLHTTGKPRSGIDIALHPAQSPFMKGDYDASRSTAQASDQHLVSTLLLQQVLEVGDQPKGRFPGIDDVSDTPTLGLAVLEDVAQLLQRLIRSIPQPGPHRHQRLQPSRRQWAATEQGGRERGHLGAAEEIEIHKASIGRCERLGSHQQLIELRRESLPLAGDGVISRRSLLLQMPAIKSLNLAAHGSRAERRAGSRACGNAGGDRKRHGNEHGG